MQKRIKLPGNLLRSTIYGEVKWDLLAFTKHVTFDIARNTWKAEPNCIWLVVMTMRNVRREGVQKFIGHARHLASASISKTFIDIFIPLHYLDHKFYVYSSRAIKIISFHSTNAHGQDCFSTIWSSLLMCKPHQLFVPLRLWEIHFYVYRMSSLSSYVILYPAIHIYGNSCFCFSGISRTFQREANWLLSKWNKRTFHAIPTMN